MNKQFKLKKYALLIIIFALFGFLISSCNTDTKKTYQYAEIYLDCENYSAVENDPGNCRVITGTTDGLRIQIGMVVTKTDTNSLMNDLGWKKESQTSKYVDYKGQSFRVEVLKYSRELDG